MEQTAERLPGLKFCEDTGGDMLELVYRIGNATVHHQLSPVLALSVLANVFGWTVDIEPTGIGNAAKVTLERAGAKFTKTGISPEDACHKAFFLLAQQ